MRTSAPIQSRSRSHHQCVIQYTDRVHHRVLTVPPSLPNDCGDLCTQHCPHSTASTDCLHSTAAHCPHSAARRACSPCSMRVTCSLAPSFPSQLNQSFENGKNGPRGTAHAQPKKESEANPAPDVIPTRGLYCGYNCGPARAPSRLMQQWTCFPALDPLASPLLPANNLPSGRAHNASLFSILFHPVHGVIVGFCYTTRHSG